MKTTLIISFYLLLGSFRLPAQEVVFDVQPLPMMDQPVHPYIFHDGSFQLSFFGKVYSYDAEGNMKGELAHYWDSVESHPNLSLIDPRLDIRYTLEPVYEKKAAVTVGDMGKRYEHPQTIFIEKMGSRGRFSEYIHFTLPDDFRMPRKKHQEVCAAWFAENGDPVFVRATWWVHQRKYFTRVYKYRLHLSDNSVEVTSHIRDCIPPEQTHKRTEAWLRIAGRTGDKIIFAVVTEQELTAWRRTHSHLAEVDFWSLDDEGREERIHRMAIDVPLRSQRRMSGGVPLNKDLATDVVQFEYSYLTTIGTFTDEEEAIRPITKLSSHVVEFDRDGMTKEYTINVPEEDLVFFTPYTYPHMNCYARGEERVFYLFNGDRTLWAFRLLEKDSVQTTFVPGIPEMDTTSQGVEMIFDPALDAVYTDALLNAVLTPVQLRSCGDCRIEKQGFSRIDDQGNARILVVEYLTSPFRENGILRQMAAMRVRYTTVPAVRE